MSIQLASVSLDNNSPRLTLRGTSQELAELYHFQEDFAATMWELLSPIAPHLGLTEDQIASAFAEGGQLFNRTLQLETTLPCH